MQPKPPIGMREMRPTHALAMSTIAAAGACAQNDAHSDPLSLSLLSSDRLAIRTEAPRDRLLLTAEEMRLFSTRLGTSWAIGESLVLSFGMDRMGTGSFRESDEIGTRDDPALSISAPDEAVQMLDASIDWDAARFGPVTLLLEGGFRAIGVAGDGGASAIGSDDSQVTPMPIVGGGVRYDVSEGLSLLGRASTSVIDTGATYIDLAAEASFDLDAQTDLIAGYRFLDANVRRGRGATLDRAAFYTGIRLLF